MRYLSVHILRNKESLVGEKNSRLVWFSDVSNNCETLNENKNGRYRNLESEEVVGHLRRSGHLTCSVQTQAKQVHHLS